MRQSLNIRLFETMKEKGIPVFEYGYAGHLDPAEIQARRSKFMSLGRLRVDILKIFGKIEDGEIDVNSSFVKEDLSDNMKKFIAGVSEVLPDRDFYLTVPFKHVDKKTRQILDSPFTEKELDDILATWQEDAETFEVQLDMMSCQRALEAKYNSITNAYNSKSASPDMTSEKMRMFFERLVFADYRLFTLYRNFIKRLASTAIPAITIKRTLDAMLADAEPATDSQVRLKNMLLADMHINESAMYEGFFNPFDDYYDEDSEIKRYKVVRDNPDDRMISKVKLWNSNVPGKTICMKNGVYAGKNFNRGDIVEESPVKILPGESLYSKSVRDAAFQFELEDGSIVYGIPLGYVSCYRTMYSTSQAGNVEYELDPVDMRVTIKALKNIRKGQELILTTNDTDFANELNPDKFNYRPGIEPIYTAEIRWQ